MRAKSIEVITDPLDLTALAVRIRASSNFRFGWQFFRVQGFGEGSVVGVRSILEVIIATPRLHEFLAKTFTPMYADEFTISTPHEHVRIEENATEVENILATAAGDHLGAYSRDYRSATPAERLEIAAHFAQLGAYRGYHLLPGAEKGCGDCAHHNNHLFSTWFYDVAWDWCLFVSWPDSEIFWIGCLTDTD